MALGISCDSADDTPAVVLTVLLLDTPLSEALALAQGPETSDKGLACVPMVGFKSLTAEPCPRSAQRPGTKFYPRSLVWRSASRAQDPSLLGGVKWGAPGVVTKAFCSPVGGAGRAWPVSWMLTASGSAARGCRCVHRGQNSPPPAPRPQAGDGGKEEGAMRVGRVL